jgi:hypothetical protein
MESMEASEKTTLGLGDSRRPALQGVGSSQLVEAMSGNKDGIARLELMLGTVFDRLTGTKA